MYKILLILTCIACYVTNLNAQPSSGPGISISYDPAGNRTVRQYVSNISYLRQADTSSTTSAGEIVNELLKRDINAYPNPTNDIVNIENAGWSNTDKASVKLYDITGKLIFAKSVIAAKTDVSLNSLPSGIYQLHYYLNEKFYTLWKIVKTN